MDELRERIRQHFTPAELVEFLGISHDTLWEALTDDITDNYKELVEETCFEFDNDTDD